MEYLLVYAVSDIGIRLRSLTNIQETPLTYTSGHGALRSVSYNSNSYVLIFSMRVATTQWEGRWHFHRVPTLGSQAQAIDARSSIVVVVVEGRGNRVCSCYNFDDLEGGRMTFLVRNHRIRRFAP